MKEGIPFSISIFGENFTDAEMGKITGIEAKKKNIILTEKNLDDCIKVLADNHDRPQKITTDDDLLNIIQAKRKK